MQESAAGQRLNMVQSWVVNAGPQEAPQGTETQLPAAFDAAFGAAGPKILLGKAQDAIKLGFIVNTASWLPDTLGKSSVQNDKNPGIK